MTATAPVGFSPEQERARQLFRFLKAYSERNLTLHRRLAEHKWSYRLRELPEHPSIVLGEVQLAQPGVSAAPADAAIHDAPLLQVRRPDLTRAPSIPAVLLDWVESGWQDPDGGISTVSHKNRQVDGETVSEPFAEDPARIAALAQWQTRWNTWAATERPARSAMQVFTRLFELRGQIELESERVELMLGDGRLRWRTDVGDIDHPVLLQRVELQFDPDVPEIRIVDADRSTELYSHVLVTGDAISAEALNKLRIELEKGGFHPLMGEPTSGYLRRLVQLLGPTGRFEADAVNAIAGTDPVIGRDPVLFLRARVSGFPIAFERILEDLEDPQEIPVSLTRLVGVTPPAGEVSPPAPRSPWGAPPDVLLSKPANQEQIEIARALEQHRAVLVQGPPGTGKSHTIANLIGHLVAHGKRVLVTSHTTKALRVLRDQLVETLRPLCVAVLENDLAARTQMEHSVRSILARLTTSQASTLESEVADLSEARGALNSRIEQITGELRMVRESEYHSIVVAGESITPSDAAQWVRAHRAGNEWIPEPVEQGGPLPIDHRQLMELYATNGQLTQAEEGEITQGIPAASTLPGPRQFSELVQALQGTEPDELGRFWSRQPSAGDRQSIETLASHVIQAAGQLARLEPWQRQVVAAGHAGGAELDIWLDLREQIDQAQARWEKARPVFLELEPKLDTGIPPEEARQSLTAIISHLEAGKTLGKMTLLLRGKWKALIGGCTINGEAPATTAHFRALLASLGIEEGRRKLSVRWARQAEIVGLPAFRDCGTAPEQALSQYASQFGPLLAWWKERWSAIEAAFGQAGFDWGAFRSSEVAKAPPTTPFERDATLLAGPLQMVVRARRAAALREQAANTLAGLARALEVHRGPVSGSLLQAARDEDPASYEVARASLLDLAAKQSVWQRRSELLKKLESAAAAWAEAIRQRRGEHGGAVAPGDPPTAWRWRQLQQEIDRRARLDEQRLSRQLDQQMDELRRVTADLIDRRAWLGQLRRTDLQARQALQGWADTQKKIGKGTGKRAPALQVQARKLLEKARDAVPVWIMPLTRVAESFDARSGRFDVVIIDEASQADVTGLLCWYLGDRVAVVGDHEQVSPLAIGQQLDPIVALAREHLAGIPNNHLYDGTTSLYHLARTSFGGTIALREHFRCVPDIIDFSNQLCYDGEIRPLRNPSTAPVPHVVEHIVPVEAGSDRTGKTNLAEAHTIAALVQAVTEQNEYADKTIGAITLLGDEQAGLIQDVTVTLIGAVELDHRRFAAGNPAQFQGDERDVIFLSMVDVPTGALLPLKQADLFKQRFNVAASRAKDQMWLIHSLDPNRDLKAGDLRRVLIEHVRDPSAKRRAMAAADRRAESPFERAVIERLIRAGYRVEPQVWVGRYRIDMVVSDGVTQVALECDGERFHGLEQIPADMNRQAILERAGWTFIRVRGTRFYRDPDTTTEWIFEELNRHGVMPIGAESVEQAPDAAAAAFRERVIRRAHEIMREQGWLPPLSDADPGSDLAEGEDGHH